MRQLSKRQKNMINKWFKDNWTGPDSIGSLDDMPIELMDKLEKINNHETIWDNVNRYLNDKICKMLYN